MEEIKTKIKLANIRYRLIAWAILPLLFLFLPIVTKAATLGIYPSSGNFNNGDTFSVNLSVISPDQAVNAISGVLSFPADKLEVLSVTKGGSIISLWVQEPSFSNGVGTVNFEGIILNPGYTGSAGKIVTVNFRTKSTGSAQVKYSGGSVLANDGQGTNILTAMGSASYNISVPVVEPTPTPPPDPGTTPPVSETPTAQTGTPAAPQIISDTHPDPNSWSAESTASFRWDLDAGIRAVRLLVSDKPNSTPSVYYDTPINQRTLDALEDGTWYFHIQLMNSSGWGSITHYRFQIDTQDPEYFNISEVPREDTTIPSVSFNFDAKDSLSGIDHYIVQIDNEEPEVWKDDGSHIYQTPTLTPGRHTLVAKALDGAGNSQANYIDFSVEAIDSPKIEKYSKDISSKDIFAIQGSTYPNSEVIVSMQYELDRLETYKVRSNDNGRFIFVADKKLRDGVYSVWLEVVNVQGARSHPSEELVVVVRKPTYQRVGEAAIAVLSVAIPLVALIVLLVFLLMHSYRRLISLRKQVKKEASEAQHVLHKEFTSLKTKLARQIEALEKAGSKRKLTAKEAQAIKKMKQELTKSEKKVEKEIRDIQKKVNEK